MRVQLVCVDLTRSRWLAPVHGPLPDAAALAEPSIIVLGPAPAPRVGATLTAVGRTRLLLFGGHDPLQQYDLLHGRPRARPWTCADECVRGGSADRVMADLFVLEVEEVSPTLVVCTWRPVPQPADAPWPPGREAHTAVHVPEGLLVYGGRDDRGVRLGDLWLYDLGASLPLKTRAADCLPPIQISRLTLLSLRTQPDAGRWTCLTPPVGIDATPPARSHHAACVVGGHMIVTGGWIAVGSEPTVPVGFLTPTAASASLASAASVPSAVRPEDADDDDPEADSSGTVAAADGGPATAPLATPAWQCSQALYLFDLGAFAGSECRGSLACAPR